MQYTTLGRRTGLRLSEFALGTSKFGADPALAESVFREYIKAGGTTFDTSNIYSSGESETVLGQLLKDARDDYVIISKFSGSEQAEIRPGTTGNSRKVMTRSVEASLRRLGTDYIDVFMPHVPDGVTPMGEILSGLDDLVRAGKIRHGGLSNFPAWRVAGAAVRSELSRPDLLVGIETEYSLAERGADQELIPMAQAHGLGVLAYSPLAGGLLTGKYRQGVQGRLSVASGEVEKSTQQTAVVDEILAVAHELGSLPQQIALAWLLERRHEIGTPVIPIIGPRTDSHLKENLAALDVKIDSSQLRRLNRVSEQAPMAPHASVHSAWEAGFDGDRNQLLPASSPVD